MASINYDDERFTQVNTDKENAINQSNTTYDDLINKSGEYYDNLIQNSKETADKQAQIQNEQNQFTLEKIEQQKQQAEKDYKKEQTGAYVDYQKQINQYGTNAEKMASNGLSNSGYSESSKVSMYNTYQNRVSNARESFNNIIQNYNNNMKDAQLQNSSALAKIYADAQAQQLELALDSFSVIKDLKLNKQNTYMALDSEYNDRWKQVEAQINSENALAEEIRQYNERMAEEKRQADMDYQYKLKALEQAKIESDRDYQLRLNQSVQTSTTSGGIVPPKISVPITKNENEEVQVNPNISTIEKALSVFSNSFERNKKVAGAEKAELLMKQMQRETLQKAIDKNLINEDEFVSIAEKYKL